VLHHALTRLRRRATLTIELSRLGARPSDRLRIAAVVLATPLRRRLRRSMRTTRVTVRLDGRAVPWFVDNETDLRVLEQIFLESEYEVDDIPPPRLIVDVGSHVGASVLFFRWRFPEARIIGFEPDPVNFRKLERNVGGLPDVELHNVAITGADGPVTLYGSGGCDGWASSLRPTTPWQRPLQVEGRTLDSALGRQGIDGIDLLKIDAEGAEYDVLRACPRLADVPYILGEAHPSSHGGDIADLHRWLVRHEHDLPQAIDGPTPFKATRRVA
jgi:FkbM family methyltransferase